VNFFELSEIRRWGRERESRVMQELRKDSLSFIETLGQSVANVSPTLTPALSVAVVAAVAGTASWLVFVAATIALLIVGLNVGKLAKRIPAAGSFFLYVSRTMGPTMGMVSGWSMLAAYLFTAMALTVATSIFLKTMLAALGIPQVSPVVLYFVVSVLVFLFAARDIRISARIGLTLEAISMVIILYVCYAVLAHRGFAIDMPQLSLKGANFSGAGQAIVLGIFSYVGFESSATLAKETREPGKTIPKAIQWTAFLAGAFFIFTAYVITMGFGDDATKLGNSAAPLADLLAGQSKYLIALVYFGATISSYACALASINAFGRLLFSLGRYQFVHSSMGLVHKSHQTPYVALAVGAGLNFIFTAIFAGLTETTTYGWWATIASYGFIVVYFFCSLAAPILLKKTKELKPIDVVVGLLGAGLMIFSMFGSVYPVPAYPYNIFPYLFLAYMVVGGLWALVLKVRSPQALLGIKHDLEGADSAPN
jgi:amino acid transporter